jgi:hypothetical protein
LAIAVFVLLPAQGTGPAPAGLEVSNATAPDHDLAPGSAQLRAVINPETGGVEMSTVRPTTPLDAETLQSLRRDAEGLVQVHHPDGSVSVHLQGRFQNVSVARIDKNGKLVICSEDIDQIDGVIQNRPHDGPIAPQELEVR